MVADLPIRDHGSSTLSVGESSLVEALDEGEEKSTSASSTKDDDDATPKTKVGEKKPHPTQFQEPDASSLLDAFGF